MSDIRRHSPSSLMRFFESPFESLIYKYLREVDKDAVKEDQEDPFMQVASKKGDQHEMDLFHDLSSEMSSRIILDGDQEDMIDATKEAMKEGVELIYQAALGDKHFFGRADFLHKIEGKSDFGDYAYEIWDAKLANKSRPKFLIQLCCYSEMLSELQGTLTDTCVLIYGNKEKERFQVKDFFVFYKAIRKQFLVFQNSNITSDLPDPDIYRNWGRFSEHAKKTLEERDHLFQVANIKHSQIIKLNEAGINTLKELATSDIKVHNLDKRVLERLKMQATMQNKAKESGEIPFSLLSNVEIGLGLSSLPPKSKLDLYFDIESNPLLTKIPLHYLWGAAHEDNAEGFDCWWAHSEEEMKTAFEDFIDWTYARWRQDDTMHVYHYGQFEITAIRELMGHFGTREREVDNLLRNEVFVDLYRVVKQSLCIGAEGYGLKAIEPLFREERDNEVSSGQDSTVVYEVWSSERGDTKDHTDSEYLKEIWDYNKDDCVSLIYLSDWLRVIQEKEGISYFFRVSKEREVERIDASNLLDELVSGLSEQEKKPHARILANLCLYHKRENKPAYWRLFDRLESTDEELVDDLDCLGDLVATGEIEEITTKSSAYTFSFDPNQETKIKRGDSVRVKQDTNINVTVYEMNSNDGNIKLKSTKELPSHLSLIPLNVVPARPIDTSIQEIAENYLKTGKLNKCLDNFLSKDLPNLKKEGNVNLSEWGSNTLEAAIKISSSLDGGYLCMQGPPGTGKTYVGSRVISSLVNQGYKIGIASNSHKAINNILEKVINVMDEDGISGDIARIHSGQDELYDNSRIQLFKNVGQAELTDEIKIVAGVAWTFANDKMESELDYLLIDEAGQVSLANMVGMSKCCKNIILMGDQMQLSQPTQGVHPEDSGVSCLDYLLGEFSTVPADKGLLLPDTYRLNSDICNFISSRVYDGRLQSVDVANSRKIQISKANLEKESGICYLPVQHEGNEQSSPEEVEAIEELVVNLLKGKKTDEEGNESSMTPRDILIVSPYNHQIRLLQEAMGSSFEVGTVDKFQGREAPIVIISMAASDLESAPRGADFLLERNRLNVALSRAQTLAILVASPNLNQPIANSSKEMSLVNFYMDLVDYAVH